MKRFVLLLVLGVALAMPAVAAAGDCGDCCDCGCVACANDCCAPCVRTRLRLARVCEEVTVCRLTCVTDECGCTTLKRVPCTKTVSRLRLVRVPVAPRCGCADCGCGCGCG